MKNFKLLGLFILTSFIISILISCDSTKKETTISDENFYKELGITLIQCYNDIYNQNLAGSATGTQNITADGPMGGTVVITGSDSYDNTHGITSTDLVFSMDAVQYIYTYEGSSSTWVTELIISGSTTFTGSFSDDYTSLNYQSNNLSITGIVSTGNISRSIKMSGAVSINRSTSTSVNIFGNLVTW
jgi:hypothetical protein